MGEKTSFVRPGHKWWLKQSEHGVNREIPCQKSFVETLYFVLGTELLFDLLTRNHDIKKSLFMATRG